MHGWTDPLDPDRHYRRPDSGDQPGYPPADGPRYPGEPTDRHPYEAGDRDPYQQSYGHSYDPAERDLYQLSDRDGYDTGDLDPYLAGERQPYDAFDPSYRRPAAGGGSAYPPVDEPAFRGGSEFFSGPGQEFFSGPGQEFFSGPGEVSTPDEAPVERRRLPRPAVLAGAAAAATLAVMIGIGAFLLPSGSHDEATRPASAAEAAAPAATGPGTDAEAPLLPPASPATPTQGARTPAPKATASSPSAPKAALRPRQAPNKAATKAGGGSAPTAGLSSQEQQVVDLVNKERAANGCGALQVNSLLMKAARLHTQDQASHNNMSHTGSDGSSMQQRIDRVGYQWRTIGENVAFGQRTPAEVMNAWMNSPGHRANILNCQFKEIGVGVVPDANGRLYWTQDFGA